MFSWLENVRTKRILCLSVCAVACVVMVCSLSWRMVNDTPVMLYQANLIVKHGLMPYRDFFCINLPGSLWMYGGLIQTLGVSDRAVHVANLLIVSIVSLFTFLALSSTCRWCALLGTSLAVLRIYSGEGAFILERELLALIPLSCLIYIGLNPSAPSLRKGVLAGLLLAWIFLIKPQLVLYGLPVVVLIWMESENFKERASFSFVMGVLFLLPIAACGVWLVKNDAWSRFRETVEYWTLYGQMTQSFSFVRPEERLHLIIGHVHQMILSPYLAVASIALFVAWWSRILDRNKIIFWGFLLAMTILVPALSGQFWGYHRLPFFYYTLCASGYLLAGRTASHGLAILVALFWIPFTVRHVYRETTVPSVIRLKHGAPDVFEDYLKENLQPGDKVQPVDWTCGVLQGMLLTDALPATRFIEYSYFLHNVSHPLIKRFRKEFLQTLNNHPPRFILEALSIEWPNGIDTQNRFMAFDEWRKAHYHVVQENEYYVIWKLDEVSPEMPVAGRTEGQIER